MSLRPLSLFFFAQGCLSAAINIPTIPTMELRRSISTAPNGVHGSIRRQVANLNASSRISYQADVTFGTQTFPLQIDTGSSDTWVAAKGFHCHSDACVEGPQYKMPGTFDPIPDISLNSSYGDGTIVQGPLGIENVTVGGITIRNAFVSIATDIFTDDGNSAISGLLGLGYPVGTSAINTTTREQILYDPIFTRMFNAGLIKENSFSLALSTDGGKLAFGSLPQGVKYQKPWAEAKINPVRGLEQLYTRYQVNAGWAFAGANQTEVDNVLMDSGSTVTSVPTKIANAVNAQFKPSVNATDFSVDCNAKVPEFGPIIGGQKFLFNAEDMITKFPDGSCQSSIQPGGDDGLVILGDAFLRSVLVVFDIGNQTLRFAKRN
jgi:hypothetical protein